MSSDSQNVLEHQHRTALWIASMVTLSSSPQSQALAIGCYEEALSNPSSGLALGLALAGGTLAKSKPADTGSTCLLRLTCFLFLEPCCHMNEAGQPSELHDPITLFSPADPQATAGHEPRLGQQKRPPESLQNAPGSRTPCPSARSKQSPGVQHVDSGFWQSDLAAKWGWSLPARTGVCVLL